MRKIILGLVAAAAIATPLAVAGTANAAPAPAPAKATGNVAWSVDLSYADLGIVTGTTTFSANDKTGRVDGEIVRRGGEAANGVGSGAQGHDDHRHQEAMANHALSLTSSPVFGSTTGRGPRRAHRSPTRWPTATPPRPQLAAAGWSARRRTRRS